MVSPPPEDPRASQEPHIVHPHLQQPGFQHMRPHTPSASPPIPNGNQFVHRNSTPQPTVMSRPSSRNQPRRQSSNLVPQQQQHHRQQSQGPPAQNGFSYMANAPIYNPHAGDGMPVQPHHNLPPQYSYPPGPQHPQHVQNQPMHDRRQSGPPTFPRQDRTSMAPDSSPPQPQRSMESQQLAEPKRAPAKSRSIFTPIDESRSILAQHWGIGTTTAEPQRVDSPPIKNEQLDHSRTAEVPVVPQIPQGGPSAFAPPARPVPHSQRNTSVSSLPDNASLSRTNSDLTGGKRPRLKVQIPSEQSDGGSATAESSPRGDSSNTAGGSANKGTTDSHSSGVVLPPPSPSASALMSAGTSGPPNPFARPHPPSSNAQNERNNIDTPMSALPSRFVDNAFLPSPSSFYPEWGFGNRGGDSNMLPSPLNFQTPITSHGPSFLREDSSDAMKRKSPEGDVSDGNAAKRVKS